MTATIYVLAWLVGTLLLLMRVRFVPLPLDFPWFYLRNIEVGVTAGSLSWDGRSGGRGLAWFLMPPIPWESGLKFLGADLPSAARPAKRQILARDSHVLICWPQANGKTAVEVS